MPCKVTRYISYLLITLLITQFGFWGQPASAAADSPRSFSLANEEIARGIYFQENEYLDHQGISGRRQHEYILTADLNDPTVQVITGKAGDKVLKLDTVSNQIAQERDKGQNVVAGINADMFNISLGTMHYGTPQGLQVKDGRILVGFETIGSGPRYPVFAVDKNRKPIITYLSMDNRLTVIRDNHKIAPDENADLTINIDSINRNNPQAMSDQMILVTPQLADQPVIGFTSEQAANATITVLKDISGLYDGSIKLGQEYQAEVVSIEDSYAGLQRAAIPAGSMVLASQGTKATWVKHNLRAGDRVRFSFNLKDQSGRRLDLEQAVTAWLPLVENGRALTQADMLEVCKNDWDKGTAVIKAMDKGRTAIGITRDNKVVAVVIDGGTASYSYGVDLPTMARRMQELGAVAAVSLDGGGSAQMNTRRFGEPEVRMISYPSDQGRERPVSNTILFASQAPKTNQLAELKVNKDITIFTGCGYTFQVRGQDSNGHPVDLSQADIKWSVDSLPDLAFPRGASIDKRGSFMAGANPGTVNISACLGDIRGIARVNVVDTIHSLQMTESGTIAVKPGIPRQLKLAAFTPEGQPVIITNQAAQWSVSPASIAVIDQQGILTPVGKGNGVVTAQVGDKKVSLNFVAGLESQLIDSYESNDANFYTVDGFVGGSCSISAQQAKSGRYSLKVDYDYAAWDRVYNGTINVHMYDEYKTPGYISSITPKKLGMWVYGDGQAPWLRAVVKDGYGNKHIIDLASRVDWTGWRYLTADLPADITAPVTLDYFYMVETDRSKALQGTIYFDDLQFTYLE